MNINIEEIVKNTAAAQIEFPLDKISNHSLLREDLGMDSFDAVELAFSLENALKTKIPQEDFSNFKTVEDIVVYLKKNKGD
jgi:acyl carrier protein